MQGLDPSSARVRRRASVWFICLGLAAVSSPAAPAQWMSYGRNPQHGALTTGPSQAPQGIIWSTPVDLDPPYSGGELFIHYGSPVITAANSIVVPVRTTAGNNFEVNCFNAKNGKQFWSLATDYVPPAHNWTPPMGITLTPGDAAVAIPGAGGTVWVRSNPNAPQATVNRIAFFGIRAYNSSPAEFNTAIQICTPITSDSSGNSLFRLSLQWGRSARLSQRDPQRAGPSHVQRRGLVRRRAGALRRPSINKVVYNCAPGPDPRRDQALCRRQPEQFLIRLSLLGQCPDPGCYQQRQAPGPAQSTGQPCCPMTAPPRRRSGLTATSTSACWKRSFPPTTIGAGCSTSTPT